MIWNTEGIYGSFPLFTLVSNARELNYNITVHFLCDFGKSLHSFFNGNRIINSMYITLIMSVVK